MGRAASATCGGAGTSPRPSGALRFPGDHMILRNLVGANPSPIAGPQRIDSEPVTRKESDKPIRPAGHSFLGTRAIERQTGADGMAKIEDRVAFRDGRRGVAVEQKTRDEASPAALHDARELGD